MFPSLTVSIYAECKLSICTGQNYSCLSQPLRWPSEGLKALTLNMSGTASLLSGKNGKRNCEQMRKILVILFLCTWSLKCWLKNMDG